MKKQALNFPRGHEWGFGRATRTHGDRRRRRLKTRGARLRKALREEGI